MTDDNVKVSITADNSGLVSAFQKSSEAVKNFTESATGAVEGLKGVFEALAAVFAVEQIAELEAHFGELAEQITRTAAMTGLTTEAVQEFNFAVTLTGGNSESAARALERLERNMAQAASGTGAAAQAFRAMGIAVTDSDGQLRQAPAILNEVANYFSKTADGANKTALAMALMGRSGAQLIPYLNQGTEGIKEFNEELDQTHSKMSGEQITAYDRLEEKIKILNASWQGFKLAVSDFFQPAAETVVKWLTQITQAATTAVQYIDQLTHSFGYAKYAPENQDKKEDSGGGKPNAGRGKTDKEIADAHKIAASKLLIDKEASDGAIALNQEENKQKLALGQETNEQFLAQELQFQKSKDSIDLKDALDKQALYGKETVEYADMQAKIVQIRQNSALKEQQINDKLQVEQMAKYKELFTGIDGAFNTTINHLLQGTETWGQAWRELAGNILMVFVEMGEKMVAQWAWQEISNLISSHTTAAGQVTANASVAGAAAVASTAAIPIVGPGLAPAAGAAAYADALSFLPSAAGGWDIPNDSLAMVHKKEMILPAELSDKIRNMTGSGGHTYNFNISAIDGNSVKDMFMKNGSAILQSISNQSRNNNPRAMAY